jgi:hypothetical protein
MIDYAVLARERVRVFGDDSEPHPENAGQREFMAALDRLCRWERATGKVSVCRCVARGTTQDCPCPWKAELSAVEAEIEEAR